MGGRANIIRLGERRIIAPNVLTMPRRLEEEFVHEEGIYLSSYMYDAIIQGSIVRGITSAHPRNGYIYNPSNANGDSLIYKDYFPAGTYTVKFMYRAHNNGAIVKIKVDGETALTADTYNGSILVGQIATASGIILSEGNKIVEVVVDGKHGSSTDYYNLWQSIEFYRTSDNIVTDSLLAHWKHDERTGGVLNDYHGGFNGVLRNVQWDKAPAGNPIGAYWGTGYDVNEIGTGLDIASGGITLVAAVYCNSATALSDTFMARGMDLSWNWAFYRKSTSPEQVFLYSDSGNNAHQWVSTDFNMANATWYIITVTFTYGTGSSIKMYKNLTEVSGSWNLGDGNSLPIISNHYVHIGSLDDVGDDSGNLIPMAGRLGDLLVYNKALDITEITQNFNALRRRYLL